MTNEEKQLLLKDLCARLPYGVKAASFSESMRYHSEPFVIRSIFWDERFNANRIEGDDDMSTILDLTKPYLRPMSSMTEEEKEYIKNRWCYEDWDDIYDFLNHYKIDAGDTYAFTDWLNEHHFDYRGLIEKGLALEAPKDMYIIQ